MFEIVMGIDDFLIQLVKYCKGENMNTQSFNQIMDETIQNHWNNTLSARNEITCATY